MDRRIQCTSAFSKAVTHGKYYSVYDGNKLLDDTGKERTVEFEGRHTAKVGRSEFVIRWQEEM
jgi:hypothetical protein